MILTNTLMYTSKTPWKEVYIGSGMEGGLCTLYVCMYHMNMICWFTLDYVIFSLLDTIILRAFSRFFLLMIDLYFLDRILDK